MKILITGAAGFMGSHLFDYLKKGHDVIGLDNFSIGTYTNRDIKIVDLVTEKDALDEIMMKFKPDTVFHLAAWAHEGLSAFCPVRITENNYNATLNVLTASIRAKVKRIVFTSSMAVYGNQNPPFHEFMNRKPVDIYGLAKSSSEEAFHILSKIHDFEFNIVRPHNVYGPRQNMSDPYRNVVAIFMNNAMRKKPMYIYGDGEQKRSFSYIDDVTFALANAGFIRETGRTFNVGPTEEFSIKELALEVAKHFPDTFVKMVPDRPLEVKNAYCTNDLAQRYLDYETLTTFSEGIKKMADWAKSVGPVEPKYLDKLEIVSDKTPITWMEKLI